MSVRERPNREPAPEAAYATAAPQSAEALQLLDGLAVESATRAASLPPQAVANVAWAYATAGDHRSRAV